MGGTGVGRESHLLGGIAGGLYPVQVYRVPDVLLDGKHLIQLQVKRVVRADLIREGRSQP